MNKTWKVALGVVLIFLLGWISGVICASIVIHHRVIAAFTHGPEGLADAVQRPLARGLDLDADQRQKFHDALAAYFRDRLALQKQLQPQIAALNQQALQQFNAFLNHDQQQRFQQNVDRLRQRTGRTVFAAMNDETTAAATNSAPASPPPAAGTNAAPANP